MSGRVGTGASLFEDRVLFTTSTVTIGEFRCTTDHPRFEDSGPIRQDCFVFPRLAVAIEHEDAAAFVANPNLVTYYNAGQCYRRQPISAAGDHCHWFAVDRAVAIDVLESVGVEATDAGEPFRWHRGPAGAAAYLEQRALVEAVANAGGRPDALGIEGCVIRMCARAVAAASGAAVRASAAGYRPRTRDAVHHVEMQLSARADAPWRLADLASAAGMSAFHLCRSFRDLTGHTLQQYRLRLRLRGALERLRDSSLPLTDIALDAGFSSHSYFTSLFRREFGVAPSAVRRAMRR